MERLAIPKQAYLDPWRDNFALHRGDPPASSLTTGGASAAASSNRPRVALGNRRSDIPATVSWLAKDDAPASAEVEAMAKARFLMNWQGQPAAGAADGRLGTLALNRQHGTAGAGDKYYQRLTAGLSEEEKRLFLLTGGRRRRYAQLKHAPTDTLGLGKPLPLSNFGGGYVPAGPSYRFPAANPFPKLADADDAVPRGSAPPGPAGGRPLPSQLQAIGTNSLRGGFSDAAVLPRSGTAAAAAAARQSAAMAEALASASAASAAEETGAPQTFNPWVATRWGNGHSQRNHATQPPQQVQSPSNQEGDEGPLFSWDPEGERSNVASGGEAFSL